MELVRYGSKHQEKPGIRKNGVIYDCSPYFNDWDRKFFLSGGLERLQILSEEQKLTAVSSSVRIGSPIARPGMIVCIGLNYSDHAEESGMDIPEEPVVFMKATNTLSGPYDDVVIPKDSTKTDWEVELGVVLGADVSYLADEQAGWEAIAGYCIVHDVSERHFQLERGGQWVKGKSCPGFTPVGPCLVTTDEIQNISDKAMKLSVNGVTRQNGSTRKMIFSPGYIVYYLSQFMILEAGDLITTGTPPGVGLGMKPPVYLKNDDVVELTIDGLGVQRQRFVQHRT